MAMSCDPVGNLLLAKFSCEGGKDACVFIPASIVFWLLAHLPVNQDPTLKQPPSPPPITQDDWYDPATPRALSVNCKELPDAIRMTLELDRLPALTILLNRANVELMRQIFGHYSTDLMNLDA